MNIFSRLHKRIAYTKSWSQTILVGLVLAVAMVFVLIFLQPFDTYYFNVPNKNLLLAGYGPCIFLPVLLMHPFEHWIYLFQDKKWFVWNEILTVPVTVLLMVSASYLYNYLYINDIPISFNSWFNFVTNIGLPFVVFLAPFWVYLRSRYGIIEKKEIAVVQDTITIIGQNKKEKLDIYPQDFVYAQSQQNYVLIYFQSPQGEVEKAMLRITLAQLNDQIPTAIQVHRSYLVNLDFIKAITGNARKRFLELKTVETPIPVSPKHYRNFKNQLSISSQ